MRISRPGLLLVSCLACGTAEERSETAREAALLALSRGERDSAIESILTLQSSEAGDPDGALEVASLWVRAGEAPRAEWLLDAAVSRSPDRDDLRVALGRVQLLLNDPARANDTVRGIETGSEAHLQASLLRAEAALELGDLRRGLEILDETSSLYPEHEAPHFARIAALLAESRNQEAQRAIEAAREALAESTDASSAGRLDILLAQTEAAAGRIDAALQSLHALVRKDPTNEAAWQALVAIALRHGQSQELLPVATGAAATAEAPTSLDVLIARLHASLGDEARASASLRRFIQRSDSPAAYFLLVEFHTNRGQTQAAAELLEQATIRFPEDAALHRMHVEALLAADAIEEARAAARRLRAATFREDPQLEYVAARLELASGSSHAAARRLQALAPRWDRPATQYWLGRALEATGDLEGARLRYGSAHRRDPRWPPPLDALRLLAQARRDWVATASHSRALVSLAPNRLEAWAALIEALNALGETQAAESAARELLERQPDRVEPHILISRCLLAQERYDEALAQLRAAPWTDHEEELASEAAFVLGRAGRIEEGLAEARAALRTSPDSAGLHSTLASLLFAAGEAGAGSQALSRAVELDPGDPRPWLARCRFRAATSDLEGAVEDCRRYLADRPRDPEAHFTLAVVLEQSGREDEAIVAYREAARLDERDMRPLNNLAGMLAKRGDLAGALRAAQQAFRLAPDSPHAVDTLAGLYRQRGLGHRAMALLERAVASGTTPPELRLHLARTYFEEGRRDEARALLEALLEEPLEDGLRAEVERALGASG